MARRGWTSGGYAGYSFDYEAVRAYGRVQTAAYSAYLPGEIPAYEPMFVQANDWHGLRVGLSGRMRLIDRLSLNADAAFVYRYLDGREQHIEGGTILPMHGFGPGGQVEASLDYPLTDAIHFGIGGRYGVARSDSVVFWSATSSRHPADLWSRRYGLFAQLSMQCDGDVSAHVE